VIPQARITASSDVFLSFRGQGNVLGKLVISCEFDLPEIAHGSFDTGGYLFILNDNSGHVTHDIGSITCPWNHFTARLFTGGRVSRYCPRRPRNRCPSDGE
jgi:hypothetical protein